MIYRLIEFFRNHEEALDRLGLNEAERDNLYKVGVPIELERALARKEVELPQHLIAKASEYKFKYDSPGKIYSAIVRVFYRAAMRCTLYREQAHPLAAATIALNNCKFGELDDASGRFELFSVVGHGIPNSPSFLPEGKNGREFWWCLATFAKFEPIVFEASYDGTIRCKVEGQSMIEFAPDSAFIGNGRLFSVQRIWTLAQAGRYRAFLCDMNEVPNKPEPAFLNYPVKITGPMTGWEKVLIGLAPVAKEFQLGPDWLAECGVPERELERFRNREVTAHG